MLKGFRFSFGIVRVVSYIGGDINHFHFEIQNDIIFCDKMNILIIIIKYQ